MSYIRDRIDVGEPCDHYMYNRERVFKLDSYCMFSSHNISLHSNSTPRSVVYVAVPLDIYRKWQIGKHKNLLTLFQMV